MKILGIDQSINSTGICLKDGDDYRYWLIPSKMTRSMEKFSNRYISVIPYNKQSGNDYITKEIAKTFNIYKICDIIRSIVSAEKPDVICIEGISYGSVGGASVIDLAGLNYCIRMISIGSNIALNIVSPKTLKKEATGNAGALKEEMVWAWKECDMNIKDVKGIKIDDLADAYFLSRCYVE